MADTLFSRRNAWRALLAGLALVAVMVVGWLLVGSGSDLFPLRDNDISRLISERWVQIYYDRSSPEIGADGDVTVVAFLDYDSEDCRKIAAALSQLHEADPGVRIVFKQIAEPSSTADFAGRALMAADRQDGFQLLHKELAQGSEQMTESSVMIAAGTAGLDVDRLRADMKDPAIAKALQENRSLADALGVSSPALIIGNRIYRGAADLNALQAAVAQARSQAPQ